MAGRIARAAGRQPPDRKIKEPCRFCQREGLSSASFYAWKRSLRQRVGERATGRAEQAELIPVEVVESTGGLARTALAATPSLEVTTPSGFTLRFPATLQPRQLTALLRAIAQLSGAARC